MHSLHRYSIVMIWIDCVSKLQTDITLPEITPRCLSKKRRINLNSKTVVFMWVISNWDSLYSHVFYFDWLSIKSDKWNKMSAICPVVSGDTRWPDRATDQWRALLGSPGRLADRRARSSDSEWCHRCADQTTVELVSSHHPCTQCKPPLCIHVSINYTDSRKFTANFTGKSWKQHAQF